ncbi:unnamed protein product [Linum trigynum]|uniref:Transposase n=1 Tax=Linum trigynum TaxID=586398 RepID=A0AAV2CGD9_9ROSI
MDVDDMSGLLNDLRPHLDPDPENPNVEVENFFKLVKESQTPLYEGCDEKLSNMSCLVKMVHLNWFNSWSNTSFTQLFKFLRYAFPMAQSTMPKNYYQAKKMLSGLGLNYEDIDACENDCVIYYGKLKGATTCPSCQKPQYKKIRKDSRGRVTKVLYKTQRFFFIKPRLQRLFMSRKIVEDMVWHAEQRVRDGKLRHPADSEAWRVLDQYDASFGSGPRNVRLGLATDDFNPFGNMNNKHSTWPVILFPYNLPPWLCMKSPYFLLTLLIPGPKSPGSNIDVYLRPFIDDLKSLWSEGMMTYDEFKQVNFNMKAAVLWTINDFPAYGLLSGWSTKGKLAYALPAQAIPHI